MLTRQNYANYQKLRRFCLAMQLVTLLLTTYGYFRRWVRKIGRDQVEIDNHEKFARLQNQQTKSAIG